jgi:WD40 repeat protein
MQINKPSHHWQLSFEGDWVTAVTFLADSQQLVAGNRAGEMFLWQLPETPPELPPANAKDPKSETRLPNHPPIRRLDGHDNQITQLRTTPDGKTLISSSLDHTIRLWDMTKPADGKAEVVLDATSREQRARRKRQDEKDEILNAPGVKVETLSTPTVLKGHQGWIYGLDISADGKRLISGDDRCLSIVWDLQSRQQISQWYGYDRVWVRSAALSPNGNTAFTCEFSGRRSNFDAPAAQARLWNATDGSLKLDLLEVWTPDVKAEDRKDTYGYWQKWGKILKRGLVCAAFSPDGKLLAVGQGGETDTGKIHLVDVETGKILRTVSGHRYGACDVKFSADGKYVLSSGRDTTVRICQVSDGKQVAELGKPRGGQFKDWMSAITVSPDQKYVAAADIAGFVHVWKLAS